jgi:hypothetical protein
MKYEYNQSLNINLDDIPETTTEPIQPGHYPVRIEKAELRDSKTGSGQYIYIMYRLLEDRRVAFSIFNIINKSPQAVEIAKIQLGSLMRAIGLERLDQPEELIGNELTIKITIKQNEYGTFNQVTAWKSL